MLITISNTRSKRVNENIIIQTVHTPGENVYMQIFMLVGFAVIEIQLFNPEEEDEEHGNSVKIEITSIIPVLHAFLDFFS